MIAELPSDVTGIHPPTGGFFQVALCSAVIPLILDVPDETGIGETLMCTGGLQRNNKLLFLCQRLVFFEIYIFIVLHDQRS